MSVICFYGCSLDENDFAAKLTEEQENAFGKVASTSSLDIRYLPGFINLNTCWDGVSIQNPDHNRGQVLVRLPTSDIYWNAGSIITHNLYRVTKALLKKSAELQLYLNRRTPVFGHAEISTMVAAFKERRNFSAVELQKHFQSNILNKLPHLCSLCGNETDDPKKVPSEPAVICPGCLGRHFTKCWSCNRTIANDEVKYVEDLPYCPTCKQWAKDLRFI